MIKLLILIGYITSMKHKLAHKHEPIHDLRHKHTHRHEDAASKKQLLEVDKQEEKFDELFDKKLAAQYREFRNLKEHSNQIRKFVRIFAVIMTLILIALLILSYSA